MFYPGTSEWIESGIQGTYKKTRQPLTKWLTGCCQMTAGWGTLNSIS
jgi:hypothetical protein